MPKRKQPPLPPVEQRKRFESLARETSATKSTETFKQDLRKLALKKSERKEKK